MGTNDDSFFNISLDDIADLQEFKPFPPGAYQVKVSLEKKIVNKHPSIEVGLTSIKVLELVDPSEEEVKPGTECNVLFMLDNEVGAGKFKKIITPLADYYETRDVQEIVRKAKNVECMVVVTQRTNSDTKKVYMDLVSIDVI